MSRQLAMACPTHHTEVVEGTWDASAQTKRLPSPVPVGSAKRVYGWYDPERVDGGEVPKDGCKLPHHQVDAGGEPGAAVAAGVRNALSRLPQSDIPASEHEAIRAHLQAHLDDMGDSEDHAGHSPGDRQEAGVDKTLRMARPVARLTQGRTDWYRITTNKIDGAEIYISDEIGWFGLTAKDFINEIRDIDRDRIALHLNSPGGEVFDGIQIYQALKDHPAQVTVHIDSLAASIASVIAMAGDTIKMSRNAQLMIHDPLTMTIGNAEDHQRAMENLARTADIIADIYAQRAGGTAAGWRKAMKAETWYTAKEAQAASLIDEVTGTSSARNDWDLRIFNYAGRTAAPAPEPVAPAEELDVTSLADSVRKAFTPDALKGASA